MAGNSPPALTERYRRALDLTFEYHGATFRKQTRVPYMAHLMSVSALAMENGADEDAAIAALLHDAVEDSKDGEATLREIRSEFGERVAHVVEACSDTKAVPGQAKPPWRERKEDYIAHLELLQDRDVLLVSLCDKVHNLRSILADHAIVGDALWDRFTTKDPKDQGWYYATLAGTYTKQIPGRLAEELEAMVRELLRIVEATSSGTLART